MSSDNKGLYTDGTENLAPRVDSIPLSDVDAHERGTASIGTLVSAASSQVSELVRYEVELAKAEIAESAKSGAIGGGLFGAAGVVLLYSTFFFFFFIAALLAVWLPLWAGFLITFAIMLVIAGILALIGLKKVKGVKKPEKTIESVQDLKTVVPSKKGGSATRGVKHRDADYGLYT